MSWEEIKEEIETNGNVKTVTMERLRDLHGAAKLGSLVRTEISNELDGRGLGHVPQKLPNNQTDQVRLYKRGTDVAELIQTVLRPGESRDDSLKQLSRDEVEQSEIIEQIRELVAP